MRKDVWYRSLPLRSRIGKRVWYAVFGWLTCGSFDRFVEACCAEEKYRLEKEPLEP